MKNKPLIIIVSLILFILFISGCVQQSSYMVPMRDGICLATDVYLPSSNPQQHGAILIRTPYNKNPLSLFGKIWAQNGWPIIIQDMRGRFASQGEDTIFRDDHTDGPDTLEWIID